MRSQYNRILDVQYFKRNAGDGAGEFDRILQRAGCIL
jgi:hypothetical protein